MVDGANYQLMLGTSFMFDVGVALFPSWETIVISVPVKLELQASLDPIWRETCAPLQDEAESARVMIHQLEGGKPKSSVLQRVPRLWVFPVLKRSRMMQLWS